MENNLDIFNKTSLVDLLEKHSPELDLLFPSITNKYQSFSEILKAHDIALNKISDREEELDKTLAQIEEDVKIGSECDKWDYIFAASTGVLAGLIDSFFVGSPTDSKWLTHADATMDSLVEKFAKLNGWKGPKGDADPTKSAIGFLERTFKVNYDHQHGKIVNDFMKMTPSNHHLKSLSHSPSPIGLIFSIIDQFRGTASFIDNGELITVTAENELQGSNVISKIFCAFVNWIGHIMSDIAGSSGGKGRGTGVPIPFYELLQTLNIGSFEHKGEQLSFADIAVKVFEQGYDFRFGMVQAIPVFMVELFTRIFCIIRHRYQNGHSWSDCMEFLKVDKSPKLRKMLLVGHGTLCLIDASDAYIRNPDFNWVGFFSRLNFVAWMRLSYLGMRHAYSILNNDIELYRYKLRAEAFGQFVDDVNHITDTFFSEHNAKVKIYFSEQRYLLDGLLGNLNNQIDRKDYQAATDILNTIGKQFGFESKFSDLDSFESFMMDD
ncbi:hypothetical protein KW420_05065 [Vibrio fluvialis]|nr:hypothetical protein [Vibrio cholerae]MBY7909133.1 hypothetical protein [Vibrio fluvialis]MBY8044968.1 hypothetical protein [Vibrio fluvialis]MBY8053589.1 hypothetical protein [Vibrio fluvialis]